MSSEARKCERGGCDLRAEGLMQVRGSGWRVGWRVGGGLRWRKVSHAHRAPPFEFGATGATAVVVVAVVVGSAAEAAAAMGAAEEDEDEDEAEDGTGADVGAAESDLGFSVGDACSFLRKSFSNARARSAAPRSSLATLGIWRARPTVTGTSDAASETLQACNRAHCRSCEACFIVAGCALTS